MKFFLKVLVCAALALGLFWSQPGGRPSLFSQLMSSAGTGFSGEVAPPFVTYRKLLQPYYSALTDVGKRTTDLREMDKGVDDLKTLIAASAPSEGREAALRFCDIVGRAAVITRPLSDRAVLQSPRSTSSLGGTADQAHAARDAAARDDFFRGTVEKQWSAQIAPLRAAAQAEWARIPEAATLSGPDVLELVKTQRFRELAIATEELEFTVVDVLPDGVVAQPFVETTRATARPGNNPDSNARQEPRVFYLEGFPRSAPGVMARALAYKAGWYSYIPPQGDRQKIVKWVFVKSTTSTTR